MLIELLSPRSISHVVQAPICTPDSYFYTCVLTASRKGRRHRLQQTHHFTVGRRQGENDSARGWSQTERKRFRTGNCSWHRPSLPLSASGLVYISPSRFIAPRSLGWVVPYGDSSVNATTCGEIAQRGTVGLGEEEALSESGPQATRAELDITLVFALSPPSLHLGLPFLKVETGFSKYAIIAGDGTSTDDIKATKMSDRGTRGRGFVSTPKKTTPKKTCVRIAVVLTAPSLFARPKIKANTKVI